MQKQNFEKQVQDKMEELSFAPSAPVWQKVEEQIRRKKDRRRLVIWFLFPLLLLTGGAFWWLSQKEEIFTSAPGIAKTNKDVATDNKNINTQAITKSSSEKIATDPQKTSIDKEEKVEPANIFSQENNLTAHQNNQVVYKKSSLKIGNKKESISVVNDGKKNDEIIKTEVNRKSPIEITPVDTTSDAVDIAEVEVKEPLKNDPAETVIPVKDTAQTITIVTTKPTKNSQWSINARIGASGALDRLFNVFSEKSMADINSQIPTGTSGNQPGPPPSAINKGLSFSVGVGVRKKLNERTSISSGLNYSYYSTSRLVGERINSDTPVFVGNFVLLQERSFFRANSQNNRYTNQYHFIEVPFTLDYQLLKKLPLNVYGGITLSQLFASKALYHDAVANVYYKKNSALRKTQLHFAAGLNYELMNNKKHSLLIGPHLQYGLTPLLKSNENNKDRLFFFGLNTKISF